MEAHVKECDHVLSKKVTTHAEWKENKNCDSSRLKKRKKAFICIIELLEFACIYDLKETKARAESIIRRFLASMLPKTCDLFWSFHVSLSLLAEELLKCCVAENIVKDVPTPMWEEHLLAGVFGYADGWIPEAQEIFQRYWHLASSCNENSSINRSSQASTICGLLDTAILVEVKHSLLILTLFYHRNEYIPVLTLDWRRHGVTLSIYMYLHLSDKVDACQSQK